ncbi:unnamed protein product [Prunus armeniaca]
MDGIRGSDFRPLEYSINRFPFLLPQTHWYEALTGREPGSWSRVWWPEPCVRERGRWRQGGEFLHLVFIEPHRAYESGVSPSFQGTNGLTALHAAVTQEHLKDKGNVEATQLLMESDSSAAYILDLSKMSALHVAAYAGHTEVMKELIRYQPDTCDLLNSKGQTALHSAVLGGQRHVVEYILKTPNLSGLINEVDEDGNTPLHIAVIYKKFEVITILTADVRVDTTAVNRKLSKAIDIFLGQNIEEQDKVLTLRFCNTWGPPWVVHFSNKKSEMNSTDWNHQRRIRPAHQPLNTPRGKTGKLLQIRP